MSPEVATARCQICWREFETIYPSRALYCSQRCKSAAQRRRIRQAATTADPNRSPAHEPQPTATRDCPHCGQPITIVALLTTPEAARPSIPTDNIVVPLHRPNC